MSLCTNLLSCSFTAPSQTLDILLLFSRPSFVSLPKRHPSLPLSPFQNSPPLFHPKQHYSLIPLPKRSLPVRLKEFPTHPMPCSHISQFSREHFSLIRITYCIFPHFLQSQQNSRFFIQSCCSFSKDLKTNTVVTRERRLTSRLGSASVTQRAAQWCAVFFFNSSGFRWSAASSRHTGPMCVLMYICVLAEVWRL